MSIREIVSPFFAARIVSEKRQEEARAAAEKARRKTGAPHEVFYFHQPDDPYAVLAAQLLESLTERFDIKLTPMLVPPPADNDAPEREALVNYSRKDGALLGQKYGLSFDDPGRQPDGALTALAGRILASAIAKGRFLEAVCATDRALWQEDTGKIDALAATFGMAGEAETARAMRKGAEMRRRLGHYLGGVFCYAGEQYWGVDRLHHLETRLHGLGAYIGEEPFAPLKSPPALMAGPGDEAAGPTIDFFLSLRSPYTHVAAPQLFALARHHNCPVRLRFVLPMMMRGIPASFQKQTYIMRDAKREAKRAGIDFGRIADPFGRPSERGLALIPYAVREGKGEAFVLSFLRGVWAEAIRSGFNRGLKKIVTRAGLDWKEAKTFLEDESWREEAEENREELFAHGLWGVPTFAVGDIAVWGQDRLWAVEDEIIRLKEKTRVQG
ncbi:2-hydroxychromene-2-carboxylate isomerase, putative [Tepidicaulis marinus]|uniref:2-hydroxychromene-2-carboxylate isomerase, putative n=1 Tax=Tepidicaulis marinus TaxID=1333998 RepID=A0A081BDH2_9HYPH|nr:DsbA family protein [Tepidicaulis marinus]GAK46090.1 2-hydroxychromene-2-carboxylate isomerase, putative [Tepidicaulis marinus]